ncbi:hypothetical protein WICPIJ_002651 [Wickerhamomyces pijperi]|uniref:Uncharacterized protein n=1 Tax=Wickerhamomyces pijperi TaxID=599730 RepID=A0A9P8Q9A5_WICPI|nr:hypothetical protein WICPIJ_002651 [Wickerhamomyces pijperi]
MWSAFLFLVLEVLDVLDAVDWFGVSLLLVVLPAVDISVADAAAVAISAMVAGASLDGDALLLLASWALSAAISSESS